ncbi:hypothetical protein [Bifidobacterium eulemuris]|uniref:LysR family transcriptional regulator n=2 Tax=Bifidobacterium eulemuris TaxID=1765219 RepID=A0A7L9SMB0_9BIFI|nr:hypothetical protein [Bifidobacterium eulemuris]QOL31076.1 hypothetical protein BE0216_00275 [Bifidobacterium eulemuris]
MEVDDLRGRHLMVPEQESPGEFQSFLDAHPELDVERTHRFYDMDTFNRCEQSGDLLLTLDAWSGVHPSLTTVPVRWDLRVPYGLLYAKRPDDRVRGFIAVVKRMLRRRPFNMNGDELLIYEYF